MTWVNLIGLKPKRLASDTAYGAASMLAWLVKQRKIAPHIPVFDNSRRKDGTLSRAGFQWNAEEGLNTCPQGKQLRTTGRVHDGRTRLFRASTFDCEPCPLKPRCCSNPIQGFWDR